MTLKLEVRNILPNHGNSPLLCRRLTVVSTVSLVCAILGLDVEGVLRISGSLPEITALKKSLLKGTL